MAQKLADKMQKAQSFIEKSGPEKTEESVSVKSGDKVATKPGKKYASYYLDRDLVKRIKVEAAMDEVQPAHLVERVMWEYFKGKEKA